jgi:hypothetical protein
MYFIALYLIPFLIIAIPVITLIALVLLTSPRSQPRQNGRQASLPSEDEGEEIMDIDDPRIPEIIRAHGRRFKKPARFVADLGSGEYVLSAEDGELLDMVF